MLAGRGYAVAGRDARLLGWPAGLHARRACFLDHPQLALGAGGDLGGRTREAGPPTTRHSVVFRTIDAGVALTIGMR
jgi:hypothetical protein